MNIKIKRLLHSLGVGTGALIIGTFIYAAIGGEIPHFKDETALNNYLKDKNLAVIEFYNPTCPVCNAFKKSGIFPRAADALPQVGFGMVSKDDAPDLLHKEKYNIEWFPTFIYFKDGKEFKRTVGYTTTFIKETSETFAQEKG